MISLISKHNSEKNLKKSSIYLFSHILPLVEVRGGFSEEISGGVGNGSMHYRSGLTLGLDIRIANKK